EAYAAASRVVPVTYESLSRERFEATFIDGARPFLEQIGVLGVPFLADPLVLYWNRDLLSAAGHANPPRYWDELYGMASALTRRSETGSLQRSGVALGEY